MTSFNIILTSISYNHNAPAMSHSVLPLFGAGLRLLARNSPTEPDDACFLPDAFVFGVEASAFDAESVDAGGHQL